MHNAAKHIEHSPDPPEKQFPMKKICTWIIGIFIIALVIWGIAALIPKEHVKELKVNIDKNNLNIPLEAVHWHPRLMIKIDGKIIPIPHGIGHTTGKIVDTHLSGMGMSPTHTHEEKDGTIHLENNNPGSKPETVTLGYFFYVWDKPFNSTCIFEYCTDKGGLKMFVNNLQNYEFQNYIMRDKDNILIEYISYR